MDAKEKPFKFVVRLPLALRHQIADSAKYYRRSMNSEIVARLEQSLAGPLSEINDSDEDFSPNEFQALFGKNLSAGEERLIRQFRRLPEDKQAALLELLS